jgi:hypothetical protein
MTREPRALLARQWFLSEEERGKEAYLARLSGMRKSCLLCNRPLSHEESGTAAYYFETAEAGAGGFIEEECYLGFLNSAIYRFSRELSSAEPAWGMVRDAARKSSFVFRPVDNESGAMVEVGSFDTEGFRLLNKLYPLREYEGGILRRERSTLFSFISAALETNNGKPGENFLFVHPVDPQTPGAILREGNYREFSRLKTYIAGQMGL